MYLDASALLAYLLNEPGQDRVLKAIVAGARITTVNFSEVAARYCLKGTDVGQIRMLKARLPLEFTPIDVEIAVRAAAMIGITRTVGLSLGDRCCLAAAQIARVGALTADRAWLSISQAIDVQVEMIR